MGECGSAPTGVPCWDVGMGGYDGPSELQLVAAPAVPKWEPTTMGVSPVAPTQGCIQPVRQDRKGCAESSRTGLDPPVSSRSFVSFAPPSLDDAGGKALIFVALEQRFAPNCSCHRPRDLTVSGAHGTVGQGIGAESWPPFDLLPASWPDF